MISLNPIKRRLTFYSLFFWFARFRRLVQRVGDVAAVLRPGLHSVGGVPVADPPAVAVHHGQRPDRHGPLGIPLALVYHLLVRLGYVRLG